MRALALFLAAACSEPSSGRLDANENRSPDVPSVDAEGEDAQISDRGHLDAGLDAGVVDTGIVAGWRALPPVSGGPLQETAVVALNNEVWMLGGYDEQRRFGDRVEIYNPSTEQWRSGPSLPVSMHHAQAAVANGRIWVLGYLATAFQESGRSFVYEPARGVWEELPPMPSGRQRGAGATAVADRIYVVGGLRGGVAVPDCDAFDFENRTWQVMPPMPRRMDHGVAVAYANKLFVIGGRDSAIRAHTSAVEVFEFAEARWRAGPPLPTSRGGMAGSLVQQRFFVLGGEGNPDDPSGVYAVVESLDLQREAWQTHHPMEPGRHGTGAATVDGVIYVPGGADVQGFGAVDRAQAYVP